MGCHIGTVPSQLEDKIEECRYKCKNQTYRYLDPNLRKFISKKGTFLCWMLKRNGIEEECKKWVREDDKSWLWEHRFYRDGKSREVLNFYENGNIWKQETKLDEFHVEYKSWYPAGGSWENFCWSYANNLKQIDGVYRFWYRNGQLAHEQTFKNGKREGEIMRWSKDGKLM